MLNGWVQAKTAFKHGPVASGMGKAMTAVALGDSIRQHNQERVARLLVSDAGIGINRLFGNRIACCGLRSGRHVLLEIVCQ